MTSKQINVKRKHRKRKARLKAKRAEIRKSVKVDREPVKKRLFTEERLV
jgi:hypothetical protein